MGVCSDERIEGWGGYVFNWTALFIFTNIPIIRTSNCDSCQTVHSQTSGLLIKMFACIQCEAARLTGFPILEQHELIGLFMLFTCALVTPVTMLQAGLMHINTALRPLAWQLPHGTDLQIVKMDSCHEHFSAMIEVVPCCRTSFIICISFVQLFIEDTWCINS